MTWGNSVVKVIFRDEFFEEKYRSRVESFLKETLDKDDHFVLNSQIYDNGEQEFCKLQSTLLSEKLNKSSTNDHRSANVIPLYSPAFEDVLQCDESNSEEEIEEKVQQMHCFNCLGDHHMKDCPEKIDRLKVAANRKDLLVENSARYHEEEMKNSVKPGILSNETRQALGLKDNQLPPYVYRMRVIGYPPGWLDYALLETSGLSLYDEEGKAVSYTESSSSSDSGQKYDTSKYVQYPGFNCPVPPEFVDEWQLMGMLPIQPHQQLSEILKVDNAGDFQACEEPPTCNNNNIHKRKNEDIDEDTKKMRNGTNDDNDSFKQLSPESSMLKTPESQSINSCNSTPKQSLGTSLSQSPGTPILEQGNRFQKLPELNKFAQGITEHLPFENLPDALGTFEKMRGILSDVQKKLQTIKKGS
ncbi:zinc finger CCHC domain-containing protein 8 [Trichonephila inaurata madagascariensis]|uniref:Zinc finger CCHC domain-containing protein 8 n=1 Tax=Trichonephila inaurata madagascariensis TaxID=2747483 RepID=A0A8X6WP33_9ARAC|nr:zinc finger CCHC domain-containing protein 8 [Trichonephila inaurata madagascariensis]